MDQLSREAKKLPVLIYNEYCRRRKAGSSKRIAKFFGSSHDIQNNLLLTDENFEDIDDTCRELWTEDFLTILFADDTCYEIHLTDKAIVLMENRFKNGIKDVWEVISSLI